MKLFFLLLSLSSITLWGGEPNVPKKWDANITLVNFNSQQKEKVKKAVILLKKVIQSKKFKEKILNYNFDKKKQFSDNQGLSNQEIYQKIIDGQELIGLNTKNSMMDLELELYHHNSKTIGYTYPNTKRVWINTKYFEKYDPIQVADNLMHEWLHKLGFLHSFEWSITRDHSVPYAVGYLVEDLAKEMNDSFR